MTDALHRSDQRLPNDPADDVQSSCEAKLRTVLRANALNSALFGSVLAVAPGVVDDVLRTGQPDWVRVVGIALLPFAALCAWLSFQERSLLQLLTPGVVVGDVAWVAASVVTVVLGWYATAGIVAVAAMALVIDVFALLQFTAWRAIRS